MLTSGFTLKQQAEQKGKHLVAEDQGIDVNLNRLLALKETNSEAWKWAAGFLEEATQKRAELAEKEAENEVKVFAMDWRSTCFAPNGIRGLRSKYGATYLELLSSWTNLVGPAVTFVQEKINLIDDTAPRLVPGYKKLLGSSGQKRSK